MGINNKGTEIVVDKLPKCSYCKRNAEYDMKLGISL